jgi:hypothetical protein
MDKASRVAGTLSFGIASGGSMFTRCGINGSTKLGSRMITILYSHKCRTDSTTTNRTNQHLLPVILYPVELFCGSVDTGLTGVDEVGSCGFHEQMLTVNVVGRTF